MSTFNKILINNIENYSISKEDYCQIITLLSELKEIENKRKKLQKEKIFLSNEVFFIQCKKTNKIYDSAEKELNSYINKIYNIDEIQLFEKSLETKKEILKIIQKYPSSTLSKSSILKYEKAIKQLIKKQKIIENEINESKKELLFLKNNIYRKRSIERYINNLTRFEIPKIKKKILKQQFYIDIFSKNKGR